MKWPMMTRPTCTPRFWPQGKYDFWTNQDSVISRSHAFIIYITKTLLWYLLRRVSANMFRELNEYEFRHGTITYHEKARIVSMLPSSTNAANNETKFSISTRVVVATAGTTDIPVAEEAAVTLEAAGCQVDRLVDVGVAGLHRILRALPRLHHPDVGCVIVCAGMDGALPSVVGGLVSVPVIAVPTSIGYGASLGGVSAMLTMMNSCSPGVGVVNIDNGFGAAALAFKCIQATAKRR